MFFELATLTVRFGTAAKANAAIKSYCEAPEAGGTLDGVCLLYTSPSPRD